MNSEANYPQGRITLHSLLAAPRKLQACMLVSCAAISLKAQKTIQILCNLCFFLQHTESAALLQPQHQFNFSFSFFCALPKGEPRTKEKTFKVNEWFGIWIMKFTKTNSTLVSWKFQPKTEADCFVHLFSIVTTKDKTYIILICNKCLLEESIETSVLYLIVINEDDKT